MRHFILLMLWVSGSFYNTSAQDLSRLHQLKDHAAPIYYSVGQVERASSIAGRLDKAMDYYQQLLSFTPSFKVFVLSDTDWTRYTTMPLVYGMPHYNPSTKELFVAAHDNALWQSFIPPAGKMPPSLWKQIQSTYQDGNGGLSMQPFFDLLALHELGHAYHYQKGMNMQRKWMGELFVNVLLHTYIAENEKESLQALTLFPRMVVEAGAGEFRFTSLNDIEERYEEIGSLFPKNYGWYQSRLHWGAADIYEKDGRDAGLKLWQALQTTDRQLTDADFERLLEVAGCKEVAALMREWEKRTIR